MLFTTAYCCLLDAQVHTATYLSINSPFLLCAGEQRAPWSILELHLNDLHPSSLCSFKIHRETGAPSGLAPDHPPRSLLRDLAKEKENRDSSSEGKMCSRQRIAKSLLLGIFIAFVVGTWSGIRSSGYVLVICAPCI